MAPKRNPTQLLEETRQALAAAEADMATTRSRRDAELAGAADAGALDKLDTSIAALVVTAGRHRERIVLLEQECEREVIARQAKEKGALIERIEAKLQKRDFAVADLAEHLHRCVELFHGIVKLGQDVAAAWPWHDAHRLSVAITPGTVMQAVSHELYRIGAQPLPLGGLKPSGLPSRAANVPASSSWRRLRGSRRSSRRSRSPAPTPAS
jgi:hypothetical protein